MEDQLDEKLSRLLRADATPERDARFRIGLIERRERARYQRHQRKLLALALLVALLTAALLLLRFEPFSTELLRDSLFGVFGLTLTAAGVRAVRGLRQALNWLRGA